MKFFVKYVITGFALSLGSALFKKIQRRVGLGEPDEKAASENAKPEPTDPNLQQQFH